MEQCIEWQLPKSIQRNIAGKAYRTDDVGMSKAKIYVFNDCVLKIDAKRQKNDETVAMMRWLEGKLPVPKVICYEQDEERQ